MNLLVNKKAGYLVQGDKTKDIPLDQPQAIVPPKQIRFKLDSVLRNDEGDRLSTGVLMNLDSTLRTRIIKEVFSLVLMLVMECII